MTRQRIWRPEAPSDPPAPAVQPGQDGNFVYLIGDGNKVEIRPVKVARQIGNEIVIASGIKGGDQAITEIPQALQKGATVQVAGADGDKGGGKGKGKKGKKGEGGGKDEGSPKGGAANKS